MFKITHPVGDRHHIETVVVECHRQAILHLEKDPLLCISLGHFLTSYAQHAFRQIDTHDTVWMQTLVQQQRQIARTRSHIENTTV